MNIIKKAPRGPFLSSDGSGLLGELKDAFDVDLAQDIILNLVRLDMLHLSGILIVSDQFVEVGDPDLAWAGVISGEFLLLHGNHAGNPNARDLNEDAGLVLRAAYTGDVAIIDHLELFLPGLVVLAVILEHLDNVKVTEESEVFLDGTRNRDVCGARLDGEVGDEGVHVLSIPLLEIGLDVKGDL